MKLSSYEGGKRVIGFCLFVISLFYYLKKDRQCLAKMTESQRPKNHIKDTDLVFNSTALKTPRVVVSVLNYVYHEPAGNYNICFCKQCRP